MLRAADADVLEALLDEGQGLVEARARLDEAGVGLEELGQPVLVLAEQEVVVLLLQPDRLDAVLRAQALGREVALVPEALAGGAVEAAVGALLDVAGGLELLHEPLHELLVLRVRGADEEVVAGAHRRGQGAVLGRHLVDVLLRREPALLRRLRDLGAVLVDAGEEEHVLPALPVMAREDVGGDGRVRVPVVRLAVDVVDGGGDVEAHEVLDLLSPSVFPRPWRPRRRCRCARPGTSIPPRRRRWASSSSCCTCPRASRTSSSYCTATISAM